MSDDLDLWISVEEDEDTLLAYEGSDGGILKQQHDRLIELGLLDPDEPTPHSHREYQRVMTAPLSPHELAALRERALLGGES